MAVDIEVNLKDLKALPVAPQILPKLQSLLGNLNTDTSDLVDLIKLDSGLAAKVLKLSNSAYYARGREVAAIDEAIGLIGYQETFRVVANSSYSSFMNRPIAVYRMRPGELWDEAVVCAFAMEAICRLIGEDVDDGYTIGLLHGIGKVAVNDAIERAREKDQPLPDLSASPNLDHMEIALVGMHHGEIGAAMLRRWAFPEGIAAPIEHRFSPMPCGTGRAMAYALSLAGDIGLYVRRQNPGTEGTWSPNPSQLDEIGLEPEQLVEAAVAVAERWSDARVYLG
jgi:putative nucleotidyltransferase with HDIG domain